MKKKDDKLVKLKQIKLIHHIRSHKLASLLLCFFALYYLYFAIADMTLFKLRVIDGDGLIHSIKAIQNAFAIKNGYFIAFFKFHLNYGLPFHYLNFAISLPGIFLENDLFIILPRIMSVLCAVSSAGVLYWIALKLIKSKQWASITTFMFLSSNMMLTEGSNFRSDWYMSLFILLAIAFYIKDNFKFKRYFWLAAFALGLGMGFRWQTITFLPLIGCYCFLPLPPLQLSSYIKRCWYCLKAIGLVIVVFVLCNPYVLHPIGLLAFKRRFLIEFGAYNIVHTFNYMDRLAPWAAFYPVGIGILFFIALLFFTVHYFSKSMKHVGLPIAAIVLINIVYSFYFMFHGYPDKMFIAFGLMPIVLFMYIKSIKNNSFNQWVVRFLAVGLVCYCFIGFFNNHKQYWINRSVSINERYKKLEKIDQQIINALKNYDLSNKTIATHYEFDCRKIGMSFEHYVRIIHQIKPFILQRAHNKRWAGVLTKQKQFNVEHWKIKPWKNKDVIILNYQRLKKYPQDMVVFNDLQSTALPYELVATIDDLYVFVHHDVQLK